MKGDKTITALAYRKTTTLYVIGMILISIAAIIQVIEDNQIPFWGFIMCIASTWGAIKLLKEQKKDTKKILIIAYVFSMIITSALVINLFIYPEYKKIPLILFICLMNTLWLNKLLKEQKEIQQSK